MKLKLVSYNPCRDPLPMSGAEVEQRLTISTSGQVWFTVRNYRQHVEEKGCAWSRQTGIGRWKAEHILSCFAGYLVEDFSETAENVGDWHAVVSDDKGHRVHSRGLLNGGITYQGADLSQLVRRLVPISNLWVFDADVSGDYDGTGRIRRFAEVWKERFEKRDPVVCEPCTDFGTDALRCGFRMDDGQEFRKRHPRLQPGSEGLEAGFQKVSDADVLGAGIYSMWYRFAERDFSALLEEANQSWFAAALSRLAELADQ